MADEYDSDDYTYRDSVIHMSDVNRCLLSSYLKRRHPNWLEQFPDALWDKNVHLKRGSVLNAGITSLFFRSAETRVTDRLPGINASLTGRLDFIDKGISWELKWSSDYGVKHIRKKGPYVPHMEQVLFYSECGAYRGAHILYWHSHGQDIYRLGIENREKIVDNLEKRAIKLHEHLKEDNPPEPEPGYGWNCDLCDFGTKICGKDKALCVESGDGRKLREGNTFSGVPEIKLKASE